MYFYSTLKIVFLFIVIINFDKILKITNNTLYILKISYNGLSSLVIKVTFYTALAPYSNKIMKLN